jgi:hypothetical protein
LALGAALLALFMAPTPAYSQCDTDRIRQATAGPSGYQERESRDAELLCEGTYGTPVSGKILTLVGLTEQYRLGRNASTRLAWESPGPSVHLQVWAREANRPQFQMDAHIAGRSDFDWIPRYLQMANIAFGNAAFLGWVRPDGAARLYVPLSVTQGESASRVPRYLVRFYTNASLQAVRVSLASVDAAGVVPTSGFIREGRLLPARERAARNVFDFVVPFSELPTPGVYYLRVEALGSGTTVLDEHTAWFHHAGGGPS